MTSRRCGVLGSPIAHSLSPVLHRAAYAQAGLSWQYDAHEVREVELADFLDSLDESWRGLSLTMPLKRTVLPLADDLTARARSAGAANTLLLDGGRRLADNTDIPGAVAAVRERVSGEVRRATVLGGGATAASVLLALAELGCAEVALVVRDPTRAAETVAVVDRVDRAPKVSLARFEDLPADVGRADLVVSTVPAHAQTDDLLRRLERAPAVFEVRYDPWPTPLVAAARERGATVVGGLDLLVHQAAEQFCLMTGIARPPVEVMRAAGAQALSRRGTSPRRP